LERQRSELSGKVSTRGGKHVVLDRDGDSGEDGDEEEPQRRAITVMPPLVVVRLRERVDTFSVDDTEGGVDTSCEDSSDGTDGVVGVDVPVEPAHPLEEVG
jgi:hypothetical protein